MFTEKDWTIPEKAGPYPKVLATLLVAARYVRTLPYSHVALGGQSKVLAERAAWDFHRTLTPEQHFDLSCVNPSFVMGPPLMKQSSASIDVSTRWAWVARMACTRAPHRLFCQHPRSPQHMVNLFTNALPALPDIRYEVVDVRDVAAQHVLLMETHEVRAAARACVGVCLGVLVSSPLSLRGFCSPVQR